MPLILPKPGNFELEEKRSKFLGYCAPINSEDEARKILSGIRAANPRANHNVFAYAVGTLTRMSDDGEPHGTAGMPVLNVFDKTGIISYICVVTRYFGGTLLGAGGLVRAYSKTAKGAMEDAQPQELINYTQFKITCAYPFFDKLKYNLDKQEIEILNIEYTTCCEIFVNVKEAQLPLFKQELGYNCSVEEIPHRFNSY